MEEKKEEKVRISVRNLVEFILREGDLDSRQGGTTDKEAMLLGGRIHRKIQRQMGGGYHAEVPLQIVVPCEKLDIIVEGRADGIIEEDGRTAVDEIKGILQDLAGPPVPSACRGPCRWCSKCVLSRLPRRIFSPAGP